MRGQLARRVRERGPGKPTGGNTGRAPRADLTTSFPRTGCVALLESLTGTAPSVGFVHGMLARTAGLLAEVHRADPRP